MVLWFRVFSLLFSPSFPLFSPLSPLFPPSFPPTKHQNHQNHQNPLLVFYSPSSFTLHHQSWMCECVNVWICVNMCECGDSSRLLSFVRSFVDLLASHHDLSTSLTLTLSLSLTLSLILTLSLSLTHTHTHTHTQELCVRACVCACALQIVKIHKISRFSSVSPQKNH